jgi:iron complex transport system substrate-binding protein
MSPNLTEILYGLGIFDRVVAVTDYCTYPPAARSLPKVGGWSTPGLERILAFQPDLVMMTDAQAASIDAHLQQLGIKTLIIAGQSIEDTLTAMETIGRATGSEHQAKELVAATRSTLESVRSRTTSLSRPTVLCVVGRTPGTLREIYVAVKGSYLAELIEIAGGRVAAVPARSGYTLISVEEVVKINPDIILELVSGTPKAFTEDSRSAWGQLPELKAVRLAKVFPIGDEFVTHASQRIVDTALLFAQILHPDLSGLGRRAK